MPSLQTQDILFINNPLANQLCELDWLGVGAEYFIEDNNLIARMFERR